MSPCCAIPDGGRACLIVGVALQQQLHQACDHDVTRCRQPVYRHTSSAFARRVRDGREQRLRGRAVTSCRKFSEPSPARARPELRGAAGGAPPVRRGGSLAL